MAAIRPRDMTKWMHSKLDKWIKEAVANNLYDLTDPVGLEAFLDARQSKIAALRQVEADDIRAKAALETIKDLEATKIKTHIANQNWEALSPMWVGEIKTAVEQLAAAQQGIKNRNGNGGAIAPAYLVTVNPKEGTDLVTFKKKVEKYAKSKMITKAEWAFEQRGVSEDIAGKGMHVHMVVHQVGTYFNGVFSSNTKRAFKAFVGNDKAVDVRPLKTDADVEKARTYIAGTKDTGKDPLKGIKCEIDVKWRAANNLTPLYEQSNGAQTEGPSEAIQEASEETDGGQTSGSAESSRRSTVD